jgi:tetratricopeptide (TPR) repeat protein
MTVPPRLPYPGLRAYGRDETDLFFGREGCVNEMVDILAATHFLAVLGTSGSGKSSLVRTGLLDALELGLYRAAGPLWLVVDCHPGGNAIRHLAAALLATRPHPVGDTVGDPFALESLETFLRRGPRSIAEWVTDGNLADGHNLLILVDQFEELFRYGDYAGREDAEAFVALLLESAKAHPRIHVVITMRSEFLGACALIPGLAERINASLYLTRRMTREECREAIVGPAGVMGFDIEPELVTKLLNDLSVLAPWEADRSASQMQRLSRQADQLPLMQHALSRLWQLAWRRSEGARLKLTLRDYEDIGLLRGALDQHAAEIIERLSTPAREVVPRVFRALIAGATLADAVRRPMRFGELCIVTGAEPALVREVVDAFRARDCNFLRPSNDQPLLEETIVDVSHESLIRQWSSLSEWFETEAAAHALWGRLLFDQARHSAGQGELLSGLDLATALAWWEREHPTQAWAAGHGGRYGEVQHFLQRSREAEEARTRAAQERADHERRSLKRRTAAFAALALVCLAAAGFAYLDNLRLDRARVQLTGANTNLQQSRQAAQSALVAKTTALGAEQVANDRVITTADRFVVGMAERLLVTPGISSDEVQRQLQDGELYLDQLATQTANKRLIRLTQVKFAAAGARALFDRARFNEGLKLARAGDTLLLQGRDASQLDHEETLEELEIGSLIAQLYDLDALKDIATGRAEALKMARIADSLPADPSGISLLDQSRARYQIARYADTSSAAQVAEAIAAARQCLELLRHPEAPKTSERWLYEGRCHIVLGYFLYQRGKTEESAQETRRAVATLERIPKAQKTIPMLMSQSGALANQGYDLLLKKQFPQAREIFMQAESLLELTPLDISERPRLRADLISRENSVGRSYGDAGDYRDAVSWYRKAHDLGFSDAAWRDYPFLANDVDDAASNYRDALGNLAWDTDPDVLKEYVSASQDRLNVLERLIELHEARWCEGCELVDKQLLMSALIKFDTVRKEDRYGDAIKIADEVISKAKAILAKPPSEHYAIAARRSWFWTVQSLPDSIPTTHPADEQLKRLLHSQQQVKEFLAAYPKAWLADTRLGRIDYALATLFAQMGRTAEAVSAAEAGAALFDKDSTRLLADWYRTGSGPVPRDLDKAKHYDEILAGRTWGLERYTLSLSALWLDNPRPFPYYIYIEDPHDANDDFIARFAYQLEYIEGVKLPDPVKTSFAKLLDIARKNHASFSELTILALSESMQLQLSVKDAISRKDFAAGAKAITTAWDKKGGPDTVKDAMAKLVKDHPSNEFLSPLIEVARVVYSGGNAAAMRVVLDAILVKQDFKPGELSGLLRMRAIVLDKLEDYAGSEADYTAALSLQPDDANLLYGQAYNWIEQGKNLPSAIAQLQRATKLAPDNANTRESLGWAQVLVGDTEAGLAMLQSAAAIAPNQADIQARLGDTFRRLGRRDEARAAFGRAASLSKDEKLTQFIHQQQALLDPPRSSGG